jgi:hypothetical protein
MHVHIHVRKGCKEIEILTSVANKALAISADTALQSGRLVTACAVKCNAIYRT